MAKVFAKWQNLGLHNSLAILNDDHNENMQDYIDLSEYCIGKLDILHKLYLSENGEIHIVDTFDNNGMPVLDNLLCTVNVSILLNHGIDINAILQGKKALKIEELKTEGSRRIQTFNGKYYNDIQWMRKSQNYQDIKNNYVADYVIAGKPVTQEKLDEYNNAKSTIERKDRYVAKINEYEALILAIQNINDIESFDVIDDAIWVSCEQSL